MTLKQFLLSFLLLTGTFTLLAQKTSIFTEADLAYKRGTAFFEKGLYGQAQSEFTKTVELIRPANNPEMDNLKMRALLYHAKSAVRLNHPDGEKLIIDFVRNYNPDPVANEAVIEAGNYYYNTKQYETAFKFFSMIDSENLTAEQKSEVLFKKGYSLFVRKKFAQAQSLFRPIKDIQNKYYYPTNYYLGMTYFFEGNNKEAVNAYQRVESSKKYRNYIPYYVCQIYFSDRRYDKLLQYALPQLRNKKVRKQKEINQLVGQAYFERGEYEKALPYLENADDQSGKMRKEDFYQLGFTQYKMQKYDAAIPNLIELSQLDSPLGQNGLYILGDCYLKTNDKNSARTAFSTAAKMTHDEALQKEAHWNYAKLSYELKYDGEAINALQKIEPRDAHYSEAQDIMSSIFLNSRDYEKAINIIEAMPTKTPKLREAYQKVTYYRGVQMYKDGDPTGAQFHFAKSLESPTDNRTKALTHFWLSEMAHNNGDYVESARQLNLFLPTASTATNFPDEASIHTGNYTMGYNFLKQSDYSSALAYFRDAVDGIKRNKQFIENEYVKNQVLGDATLRTGDCFFNANDYPNAEKYYDEAINQQYTGYQYAIYQKGIVEGLQNKGTNKIITLERLVSEFPRSEYTDDALLELGNTYQIMGKNQDAIEPLVQLIDNFGNSPLYNQALIKLGLISYNQGAYEEAIAYYKDVFKNNPEEADAQASLAALKEIYVDNLAKPDEFFKFLDTSGYKVEDEQRESINYQSAETQFENGNFQRAIRGYQDYLKAYPKGRYSLQATYNIAESYAAQDLFSEALKWYEKVIKKDQSIYYGKALNKAALIAYNHEQDFAKAYNLYSRLEAEAATEDLRFDAQLGALRSAYRTNNLPAVSEMADKVMNNPKASKEQIATANFYLGKMAFDKRDFARATEAFNIVIRNSDNEQTAEARYLVAQIYYQEQDLEVAKQICINANKESSNYPYWVARSVILMSDILVEQEQLLNARAALEAVVENFTQDQGLVREAEIKLIEVNRMIEEGSRLREEPVDGNLEMDEEGNE